MKRWESDDRQQKAVRDVVLGPGLYGPFSKEGRYVYVDKGRFATILQKRYAVDTIIQRHDGRATCIEEKIVRWPFRGEPYDAITLETQSCTVSGHESPGWMEYGQADWLNYAMCQEKGDVLCHIINFQGLKDKFWPAAEQFALTVSKQHNKTACRVVPLAWIEKQEIGYFPRLIHATPEGAEIVKAYNQTHYKRAA